MDGGLYGPGLENRTSKPVVIIGSTNHMRENQADDWILSWLTVWPNLKGWRRQVLVQDTLHYGFSNYPILFETLGITSSEEVGQGTLYVRSFKSLWSRPERM